MYLGILDTALLSLLKKDSSLHKASSLLADIVPWCIVPLCDTERFFFVSVILILSVARENHSGNLIPHTLWKPAIDKLLFGSLPTSPATRSSVIPTSYSVH